MRKGTQPGGVPGELRDFISKNEAKVWVCINVQSVCWGNEIGESPWTCERVFCSLHNTAWMRASFSLGPYAHGFRLLSGVEHCEAL